jgi:hypothetical protein
VCGVDQSLIQTAVKNTSTDLPVLYQSHDSILPEDQRYSLDTPIVGVQNATKEES